MNWIQRFLTAIATHKGDASAHHAKTTEIFSPFTYGTDMGFPLYGALIDGAGDEAYTMLLIPQDFTSLDDLEVIFASQDEGIVDMHFTFNTYYGAYDGGEVQNAHGESESHRSIGNVTESQNVAHSIADLVDTAPLVAGDLLQVKIEYSATPVDSNAFVKGIRLKYS